MFNGQCSMDNHVQLPDDFVRETRQVMGEERFTRFLASFGDDTPVSIRLNPAKLSTSHLIPEQSSPTRSLLPLTSVPWCALGRYLRCRPNFTFDPLLHAGCYYVQEAASMFIDHVFRCLDFKPLAVLDLCAAPGGKSTAVRSVLPADAVLISNEPVRQRAQVLSENLQKWGYANTFVTNAYPKDFRPFGSEFDLIVCDVPCSGEGMFRKDAAAIGEWSLQNVERCWQLQRDIVNDAWQCLRPGGVLVYSTCTFNLKENEQNVRWMMEQFEALPVHIPVAPEWGITGSLLPGFDAPVYRFIPGITRTEGLFVAVLRKPGSAGHETDHLRLTNRLQKQLADKVIHGLTVQPQKSKRPNKPYKSPPTQPVQPSPAEALAVDFDRSKYPLVELDYPSALAYLRREALVLPPDVPRGFVVVTFEGHPLGFVKNIGPRANNLYPPEWRIKSTHLPDSYERFT